MKTAVAPKAPTYDEIRERIAAAEQTAKQAGEARGALVRRLQEAEQNLPKLRCQLAIQEDPAMASQFA